MVHISLRRWIGAYVLMLAGFLCLNTAATATEQKFDSYTPLASNLELARRLLPPLTQAQIPARLGAMGKGLKDQAIDLTKERFNILVPSKMPLGGYGLLVFIPPWQDGHIPDGWASTLDRLGYVFVSPLRSGNDENVLARREPLAVLAAYNTILRYKINKSHVFISGFSGGSRVAMRLAIAYPDLFHGAFLDAGSDPLAGRETPLPPRELFEQFRQTSALVYASGSLDDVHIAQNAASLASLHKWCAPRLSSQTIAGLGHEPAPPSVLAEALTNLAEARQPPSNASELCWNRAAAAIDAQLDAAAALEQRGDFAAARGRLRKIDQRFGGLAAPRIDDLARTAGAGSFTN